MKAMSKKGLKHSKIYTGSLETELHPVPSHTKMDFTKSQESFTKYLSRTTFEPYQNYKYTL